MAEQGVTDEQLTYWDELASLATSGPWHGEHGEHGCVRIGDFGWVCSGPNVPDYDVDSEQGKADAEFIAHAREALPALVAEVRASRAREARLRALTYASDDGSEYTHTHRRGEGEPECPACWADDIRAALTGALPT